MCLCFKYSNSFFIRGGWAVESLSRVWSVSAHSVLPPSRGVPHTTEILENPKLPHYQVFLARILFHFMRSVYTLFWGGNEVVAIFQTVFGYFCRASKIMKFPGALVQLCRWWEAMTFWSWHSDPCFFTPGLQLWWHSLTPPLRGSLEIPQCLDFQFGAGCPSHSGL